MSERFRKHSDSRVYSDGLSYLESQRSEENLPPVAHLVSPDLSQIEEQFYKNPRKSVAMNLAVQALETHIQKKDTKMGNELVKQVKTLAEKFGFTEKQLDLIKRTVAKNATDEELELFFYRCTELNLNPLMPGQIYFLKFKNRKTQEWNPGTIVIGVDGFRCRAHRTGKLSGVKRGVIRNQSGQCIGGWADVYRKDWDHPAHEEVPISEYIDEYKQTWQDMPETMIKKVAEVAAYRIAFPEELSGVYSHEEMDQASKKEKEVQSTVENISSPEFLPKVIAPISPIAPLKPSDQQLKDLWDLAKTKFESPIDEVKLILKDIFHESTRTLNLNEYIYVMDHIKSLSGKKSVDKEALKDPLVSETGELTEEQQIICEQESEEAQSQDVPWAKYRN